MLCICVKVFRIRTSIWLGRNDSLEVKVCTAMFSQYELNVPRHNEMIVGLRVQETRIIRSTPAPFVLQAQRWIDVVAAIVLLCDRAAHLTGWKLNRSCCRRSVAFAAGHDAAIAVDGIEASISEFDYALRKAGGVRNLALHMCLILIHTQMKGPAQLRSSRGLQAR